jgi:hypothetical protein
MGDGNYEVRWNDELGDTRHLVLQMYVYYEHMPHFLSYCYKVILNLQNQSYNIKWKERKKIGNFPRNHLLGHYAKAKP